MRKGLLIGIAAVILIVAIAGRLLSVDLSDLLRAAAGMNGATAEQCDEFLMVLAEFKAHVAATSQNERFADLIRDCEFHYQAYADYRRSGPLAGGYEQYLARHGAAIRGR